MPTITVALIVATRVTAQYMYINTITEAGFYDMLLFYYCNSMQNDRCEIKQKFLIYFYLCYTQLLLLAIRHTPAPQYIVQISPIFSQKFQKYRTLSIVKKIKMR